MDIYCLIILLPVEEGENETLVDGGRMKKCAIVFDGMDIIDKSGQKDRVDVCDILFGSS